MCSMFDSNILFRQVLIATVNTTVSLSCRRLIATKPCTKQYGMLATAESLCEHTLR